MPLGKPLLLFSSLALALVLPAAVQPHALFSDHAVLQQGRPVPVWGTARAGEKITVELAGQAVTTTAGADGAWRVMLAALPAGGPHTLTFRGDDVVTRQDVLVGEVWLASGQSNMERQLGPRPPQPLIVDWQAEVAAANHPLIREFAVPQKIAFEPQTTVAGRWVVCTPESVVDFSAVGYFFARDVHRAQRVPVGVIHSSWGGTIVEAWTGRETAARQPATAPALARLDAALAQVAAGTFKFNDAMAKWFDQLPIPAGPKPWTSDPLPGDGWTPLTQPQVWAGELAEFDGVLWLRRELDLPADWAGAAAELTLGAIDDLDATWLNGTLLGTTGRWNQPRHYAVPAGLLRAGRNVLAIAVVDTSGPGGLTGQPEELRLTRAGAPGSASASVDVSGPWLSRRGAPLAELAPRPSDPTASPNQPTVLFNGMIAPLVPYALRGAIWYQGEANAGNARDYRTLFPAMIADWRTRWADAFPFLFVQIAPYRGMTPEIREAQLLSVQATPRTAMAVTLDVGDPLDIHPANKRPVGARLALGARALAYGETLEYSGPLFASARAEGTTMVVTFSHLGGGLVAPGGELRGFTLAGEDGVAHPARAVIAGDTVVVSAPAVTAPVAVRYAWSDTPVGNLFNRAGLPASPFRSDVE